MGAGKDHQGICRAYATTKPATIQWGNALDTSAMLSQGQRPLPSCGPYGKPKRPGR